jgi:oxepin-CoA hydrolase/3-oxo-5,6-dehydrosuberyl-CoA semialdehyde dehydrogenase
VRAAVARLSASAKVAFGDPHTVNVTGADSTRGAFISPMLLRGDDVFAPESRDVVAFGPVCTVLPYAALDEVVAATTAGGGLTATIVTHDRDVADGLLTELAPGHGRLRVLDRDSEDWAAHAAPQLVHGGPGSAGGGADLGGLTALAHYQQRTAIQGHPSYPWRHAPIVRDGRIPLS